MSRPRVLVADDHRIVAEGIRGLLESEFEVVGIAGDGSALLSDAKELRPDVVVVDVSMPLLNGIEACAQLKKADRSLKIIILTMHPDVAYAARAIQTGASGYVLKHAAATELVTAVREALNGRTYLTPMIANDVLQSFIGSRASGRRTLDKLTPRQREVLQLIAEGRSAKEVGAILNISPRTVEFHKYRIMEDLRLPSHAKLVSYAIKHGIASV